MPLRRALPVAALLLALACQNEGPDVAALSGRAEALRGLAFKSPVAVREVDAAGMAAAVREEAARQMEGPRWAAAERALKAFALVPRKSDLRRTVLDLLDAQVVGLYDPHGKRLFVAAGPGSEVLEEYGALPGMPEGFSWQDFFVLHELVHALTDQHFDLAALPLEDLSQGDRASAARCVVEGDATWVMLQDLYDALKATPEQRAGMGDLAGTLGLGRDLMGESVPPYLTENLLVGYLAGFRLVDEARRRGGPGAVDALYRTPPPSMEQVLHPEKYFAGVDPPVALEPPVPAAGWGRELFRGVWGEFDTRLVLRAWGVAEAQAEEASEGWGGDAFAVFEVTGGGTAFAWETAWDTPQDADEFERCLRAVAGLEVTRQGQRVRVLCAAAPPAARPAGPARPVVQ